MWSLLTGYRLTKVAATALATSIVATGTPSFAAILHVDETNQNPGAGTSWGTALTTLQGALLSPLPGPHTIRIKQGTYYVDEGLPGGVTRDSTFFIPTGTVILGGYPLTVNPADTDRNPLRFPVTLSADLDRNDNYTQFVEDRNYSSLAFNAHHCLVVADAATSTTEISGIIV